jgi:hypothetical protein
MPTTLYHQNETVSKNPALTTLAKKMDGVESYAELYHMMEATKDAALLLMVSQKECVESAYSNYLLTISLLLPMMHD